jgi:hypothetical protein
MALSINLNHQALFVAVKIQNELVQRMLPPEFESKELFALEALPQFGFLRGKGPA